jgi:hypothetical protein
MDTPCAVLMEEPERIMQETMEERRRQHRQGVQERLYWNSEASLILRPVPCVLFGNGHWRSDLAGPAVADGKFKAPRSFTRLLWFQE